MLCSSGSPLHPTTEGCLGLLERLQEKAAVLNALDMGCGTGILSMVAARAWDARVLAVDISEKAVADTRGNAAACGLGDAVHAVRSDGFLHALIRERAPYDLIIGNLVAETLIRLAPDMKAHLAPGGHALLSGSLLWLAEGVEEAYQSLGFEVMEKKDAHGWRTWLWRAAMPLS